MNTQPPSDQNPQREVRVLWTEMVDRPLTERDFKVLEEELGFWIYAASDEDEPYIGQRSLRPNDSVLKSLAEDSRWPARTYLRLGRRYEYDDANPGGQERLGWLPGVMIELVTDEGHDDRGFWELVHQQCAEVLGRLGLEPPGNEKNRP
jgi:hypothetical protein